MKNTKISLAAILIICCSFGATAQTSDEIIAKHITAIGGLENWNKLKSLKMEGTIKAQGAEIKITIFQVDKKCLVLI